MDYYKEQPSLKFWRMRLEVSTAPEDLQLLNQHRQVRIM